MNIKYVDEKNHEKLAALLARYSRSNDGINSLVEKHKDSSPDSIFKFVDYGHASIAGLTGGIPIALDGISMLLALRLFEITVLCDGQESSTRYITMDESNVCTADEIGLCDDLSPLYDAVIKKGFELYNALSHELEEQIKSKPYLLSVPKEASQKIKNRLRQNYALDRCRYFLPMSTKTNVAIVATARVWADTIKHLDSIDLWKEAKTVAAGLRRELNIVSPNLVRHSFPTASSIRAMNSYTDRIATSISTCNSLTSITTCETSLEVFDSRPRWIGESYTNLEQRENRYSSSGDALKRRVVRVEWSSMALAELRDLMRHRSGHRWTTYEPNGFYFPDCVYEIFRNNHEMHEKIKLFLMLYKNLMRSTACGESKSLVPYTYFLGTCVPFEHTMSADKFLYEVELRTGLGAHFRYADHLRDAGEIYLQKYPEEREFVKIGNAEPEF